MKKIISSFLITVGIAACAPAHAEAIREATIIKVEPNYYWEKSNVPVETCQNVEVPIYGQVQGGGASGGDVLGGALLGGILGKALTGEDNAAAFGAIVGAMTSAESKKQPQQKIVGYQTQKQCGVFYQEENIRKIKNWRITYKWNGIVGQSYTYNNYSIGSRIPVGISIVAK